MTPPLRVNQTKLLTDMAMCLDYFRLYTPGSMVCTRVPVRLDDQTLIEVDIAAVIHFGVHKQCSQSPDDDCLIGAPNLVLDIHTDDARYQQRRALFEQAGVVEYVSMIEGEQPGALWNQLVDGRYQLADMAGDGVLESLALPGLRIPLPALRAKEWFAILAAISQGMAYKGHHDLMATIWSS